VFFLHVFGVVAFFSLLVLVLLLVLLLSLHFPNF
jgi:hypothetical protein